MIPTEQLVVLSLQEDFQVPHEEEGTNLYSDVEMQQSQHTVLPGGGDSAMEGESSDALGDRDIDVELQEESGIDSPPQAKGSNAPALETPVPESIKHPLAEQVAEEEPESEHTPGEMSMVLAGTVRDVTRVCSQTKEGQRPS